MLVYGLYVLYALCLHALVCILLVLSVCLSVLIVCLYVRMFVACCVVCMFVFMYGRMYVCLSVCMRVLRTDASVHALNAGKVSQVFRRPVQALTAVVEDCMHAAPAAQHGTASELATMHLVAHTSVPSASKE